LTPKGPLETILKVWDTGKVKLQVTLVYHPKSAKKEDQKRDPNSAGCRPYLSYLWRREAFIITIITARNNNYGLGRGVSLMVAHFVT
jgi:hypothetical protein